RELAGPATTWTERGILAIYVIIPLAAVARWRVHGPRARRYLLALLAGYAAVVALLFGVYVVGQWSGYRYALLLVPPLLPLVVPRGRWSAVVVVALGVAGAALVFSTRSLFNDYKASRQKRQAGIADYVDRYVAPPPERIVLPNGWLYGWRHPDTEVV